MLLPTFAHAKEQARPLEKQMTQQPTRAGQKLLPPFSHAETPSKEQEETLLLQKQVLAATLAIQKVAWKCTDTQAETLLDSSNAIALAVSKLMQRIAYVEGQNACLKDARLMPPPPLTKAPQQPIRKTPTPTVSLADFPELISKSPQKRVIQRTRSRSRSRSAAQPTFALLVKTGEDAETVKANILRDLPAKLLTVSVAGVRKKGAAGVILEMRSKEARDHLITEKGMNGLTFEQAPTPGQKVRIIRVRKDMTDAALLTELAVRNRDREVTEDVWRSEMRIVSRGKTGDTPNVTLEVSKRIASF